MCFSAEASFIASAFLFTVAAVSYCKVVNSGPQNKKYLALVLVPLCFAIQQFSEGFVWLSLLNNFNYYVITLSTYSFMFFAFIFWPICIPGCLYYLEPKKTHKNILKILLIIGSLVAAALTGLMLYFGIIAQAKSCHILYELNLFDYQVPFTSLIMLGYLLATVLSLLVSSLQNIRIVGFLMGITYANAYIYYHEFLTSVWCFFAAIVSLLIYWVILHNLQTKK